MSLELLVLLLALEVEDQDLVAAAFLHHTANNAGAALRLHDGAGLSRDRQHIREFNIAVLSRLLVNFDYVSGRDAKLPSPGADHRVHRLFLLCRSCLLIPTSRSEDDRNPQTRTLRTDKHNNFNVLQGVGQTARRTANTKGAKVKREVTKPELFPVVAIYYSSNAIFQMLHVEVDKESERLVVQTQVRKQLG